MPEDIIYVKDLIKDLQQMNPFAEVWIQREDKIGSTRFEIKYLEEVERKEYTDHDSRIVDEVFITFRNE